MREQYRRIIDMPHHVSKKRRRMKNLERAAQFAPFAALVGFDDAIQEAALVPEPKWAPDKDDLDALNDALELLSGMPRSERHVKITRVEPDAQHGVRYTHYEGTVRHIDPAGRTLTFEQGAVIPLDQVASIRIAQADGASEHNGE